jgi:integrase
VSLGKDTNDPEFWRKLRDAKGAPVPREGTFSPLIAAWRKQNWERLRPATRKNFGHYLNRLDAEAGDRLVAALLPRDIYQMMDGMSATPRSANQMLTILRLLLQFGVQRGYCTTNPAIGIEPLKVDASGQEPWAEEGYRFVMQHAPLHVRRMAYLGRATGQRVSDLVKMRATDLAADGIFLRIGKLRDKPHLVPLSGEQMAEIRSWGVRDLDFLISTPGTRCRCSAGYLNVLWNNWRASSEAAPIRSLKLTIHGLRATKIKDLRRDGAADGSIADELGMSVGMVARYLRFDDKIASARASRDRRERNRGDLVNPVVQLKTPGS